MHTLSLRSLAREVGCAPSTLLKLYGSFNNLLQHVNIETLGRLRVAIDPLLEEGSPEQRLKRWRWPTGNSRVGIPIAGSCCSTTRWPRKANWIVVRAT